MTPTIDDFDAGKAIVEQLKGMEKGRQQRVLRWVAESLDLTLPVKLPSSQDSQATPPSPAVPLGARHTAASEGRSSDIKTFVESKKPKSDMQFAAVVAYYYRFEARPDTKKETINPDALQDAARLAGRKRLVKPLMTLNNAKNQGYLDSAGRAEFSINSVGENLVAMTLPGTEGEPVRRGSGPAKNRKGVRRKRS